jgi:purine-binding chemotaxis protein CheW
VSRKQHKLASSAEALQTYLQQLLEQARDESQASEASVAPEAGRVAQAQPTDTESGIATEHCPSGTEEPGDEDLYYLFEVAGLTFAVPEVRVVGEMPMPTILTPPLGQPWRHIAETDSGPVIVVDTARMVLPERQLDAPEKRPGQLLILDQADWALVVDAPGIREPIDLQQVRWRSSSGRRVWLAGTLVQRRCALLDLDEISRLVL